jgi:ribonuclease HI
VYRRRRRRERRSSTPTAQRTALWAKPCTAGFGVKGGETDRVRACRLAGAQNNHKAELLAINAALTMAPSYGEGTESIRIYSDSQAHRRMARA